MHAEPKEKTLTEFLKLNVRVLNTWSRMTWIPTESEKKSTSDDFDLFGET